VSFTRSRREARDGHEHCFHGGVVAKRHGGKDAKTGLIWLVNSLGRKSESEMTGTKTRQNLVRGKNSLPLQVELLRLGRVGKTRATIKGTMLL
jgi:hypothetical protein